MKKLILILPIFLAFSLALPVFAVKTVTDNKEGIQSTSTGQPIQQQLQVSPSSTGNQVQNQNQVRTQNQGEDSRLQVNTQIQERLEEGTGTGSQNRNQNAFQNMNQVATQVQQLLQIRTAGGIGEQIRTIAQTQNQSQTQIREQLNKLESKGKLARLLTGTDYGAIKNLQQQLEQNQLRIQQLTQLQNQLSNQEDIKVVQEAIQFLTQENTSLQEKISAEEQTRSLFGWLFKLFSN